MTGRIALVTGASGYLGRPLVQLLSERGWQVRAVSRSIPQDPGTAQWLLPEPVTGQNNSPIDQAWQPSLDALANVDTVFHLAGIAHQRGQSLPDVYHRANALGSEAVARRTARQQVRHLVLVSSVSAVGADSRNGILTPDTEPQPVSSYGISKLQAERLVTRELADTGTALSIVRPPLVYGPHPKANLLTLVRLLRTGLPLPLGAVNNKRSMIALPNLLDLLLRVSDSTGSGPRVLMPSDITISTPVLIEQIRAVMSMSPRLFNVPPPVLRLASHAPVAGRLLRPLIESLEVRDNTLLESLHWQPPVAPADVISRMVQSVVHGDKQ